MKSILLAHLFLTVTGLVYGQNHSPGSGNPEQNTIKIGLLIQNRESDAAIKGAELAIKKANKKDGFNGRKFGLVVRSMEGPWGTGSKQAVDLIFEENVWALLGYHDGRNAHLVEQAATKSIVPFISAWSSDPTLSQAFVPWFFNCVPTDRQQAQLIVKNITGKYKPENTAVITGDDYDSKLASDYFFREMKDAGVTLPRNIEVKEDENIDDILSYLTKPSYPQCLVLFCQPRTAARILGRLRLEKLSMPVYCSIMTIDENELDGKEISFFDDVLMVAPADWTYKSFNEFMEEYKKMHNRLPGMVASYSYDAAYLVCEAIRIAGTRDRASIQDALGQIRFSGATGVIRFDEKGNRRGIFEIRRIKNGLPLNPQ
jgi:branched-chain amino acid transport system substrate-binding protein